jgi:hypothetical protein
MWYYQQNKEAAPKRQKYKMRFVLILFFLVEGLEWSMCKNKLILENLKINKYLTNKMVACS